MRWNNLSLIVTVAAAIGFPVVFVAQALLPVPEWELKDAGTGKSACATKTQIFFNVAFKTNFIQATDTPSPTPSESPRRTEFFVMIDPSHGGYDTGANFGNKLLEKDITLKLAREPRKELDQRGIPARMLRDSAVDIALDRRAEIANEQRAGLYIALHAGRPGHGVRIYAPLLPDPRQPVAG